MRLGCKFLAVVVLLAVAPITRASPIFYGLEFTAELGSTITCMDISPCIENSAVGNQYFGFFGVDSAVLASDGINKGADMAFFVIQMEDNIWAYNFPGNNSFVGFRGPRAECPLWCLGAPSPGFDVVGGEIVRLHGGVFGFQDVPFVDFSFLGDDSFSALGHREGGFGLGEQFTFVSPVQGHMNVFRIPEPGSLVLLGLGLLGVVTIRRSRTSRR